MLDNRPQCSNSGAGMLLCLIENSSNRCCRVAYDFTYFTVITARCVYRAGESDRHMHRRRHHMIARDLELSSFDNKGFKRSTLYFVQLKTRSMILRKTPAAQPVSHVYGVRQKLPQRSLVSYLVTHQPLKIFVQHLHWHIFSEFYLAMDNNVKWCNLKITIRVFYCVWIYKKV